MDFKTIATVGRFTDILVGSSMVITTGMGPMLFGFPALGVVGYIISGLLGLWLIFDIIRKQRY